MGRQSAFLAESIYSGRLLEVEATSMLDDIADLVTQRE